MFLQRCTTALAETMQRGIDASCKRGIDAGDARDVFDSRVLDSIESSEMPQQAGASSRTNPRNVLEAARVACLLATAAVPGDCEAMRFIAQLLDQLERR